MVIVIIEKMAKHDIVVRCWYFEFVLVLLDIIRGQLAKEDIIAFLHVKSVDCLFLPSLRTTRCSFSLRLLLLDVDKTDVCFCFLG
jgi:hypothetical protein